MQTRTTERGRRNRPVARTCRTPGLLLACAAVWLSFAAQGIEMPSLYTVEVPYDSSQRTAEADAYRAALAEVIVRITGTTAVMESESIAGLFPNPRQFVLQLQQQPADSTMLVTLDGEAVAQVLRRAGAPVWGSDRPLTLVWLAVDWGMGTREIIAADDPIRLPGDARSIDRNRLLRERIQEVATRRGIPVAFPLLDTEDFRNISFTDIWGGFDERVLSASARYQADSVLVGRIRTEDVQAHRWTWYFGDGRRADWPGEPEEAIGILADALAAEFVIGPNQATDTIQLTISGIDSVVAFGRVQRMMENLRVVDKLTIRRVAVDKISYEVEIPGGVDRLRSALAGSGMLVAVQSTGAMDARSFRRDEPGPVNGSRMPNDTNALEYLYRSRDD